MISNHADDPKKIKREAKLPWSCVPTGDDRGYLVDNTKVMLIGTITEGREPVWNLPPSSPIRRYQIVFHLYTGD